MQTSRTRNVRGSRLSRALVIAGLTTALVVASSTPATAQTVSLTTPFPTVDVEAGDSITLDLEIRSDVRQRVDLAIASVPDGWDASLRGGGFAIGSVTTDPEGPVEVTLNVEVPADAADGAHAVVIDATATSGASDRLEVELRVAEQVAGAVTLETEFPRLTGGSEDTFSFDLTLRNDLTEEATFALVAAGPEGWQIEAHPSTEQRANTVTVEPGSTASIDVEITPAANAQAGEYPVVVEATGSGQRVRAELVVELVGSVQLELTTPTERLNASGTAGAQTRVELLVVNDGSAPLAGVTLSGSPPSGWEVAFEPETVATVPPGEAVPVTAIVTPAEDAVTGDYAVSFTASGQGRSSTADIRFTVETSPTWGIVGVLIVAAAIGLLALVFRRYGRR